LEPDRRESSDGIRSTCQFPDLVVVHRHHPETSATGSKNLGTLRRILEARAMTRTLEKLFFVFLVALGFIAPAACLAAEPPSKNQSSSRTPDGRFNTLC